MHLHHSGWPPDTAPPPRLLPFVGPESPTGAGRLASPTPDATAAPAATPATAPIGGSRHPASTPLDRQLREARRPRHRTFARAYGQPLANNARPGEAPAYADAPCRAADAPLRVSLRSAWLREGASRPARHTY